MTDIIFSLIFVLLQLVFLWGTWGIMACLKFYLPYLVQIATNTRRSRLVFEYQVIYFGGRELIGMVEIDDLNKHGQEGWELVQMQKVNDFGFACTMKRIAPAP